MKKGKEHIAFPIGFVRFKNNKRTRNIFELNWNIYNWSLPLKIEVYDPFVIVGFLFLDIFIFKNGKP